jgi:hypothetical protein
MAFVAGAQIEPAATFFLATLAALEMEGMRLGKGFSAAVVGQFDFGLETKILTP